MSMRMNMLSFDLIMTRDGARGFAIATTTRLVSLRLSCLLLLLLLLLPGAAVGRRAYLI